MGIINADLNTQCCDVIIGRNVPTFWCHWKLIHLLLARDSDMTCYSMNETSFQNQAATCKNAKQVMFVRSGLL